MLCQEERVETKVIREYVTLCDGCGARKPSDSATTKNWISFTASWNGQGDACSNLCMVEVFGGADARAAAKAAEDAAVVEMAAASAAVCGPREGESGGC